jgi:hypothetical protein
MINDKIFTTKEFYLHFGTNRNPKKKILVHRTEIETISNQELPQLQKHVKN